MSIARQHKQSILKNKTEQKAQRLTRAGVTTKATPAQNATFATLKESLSADLITLKHANGDAERNPFKKELIVKYHDYVKAMMQHSNWAGQTVIFYWFLWRLDIEGFESVQSEFYSAIEHGLTTPESFKRDWQTFYLDTVYRYTNEALKAQKEFKSAYLKQAIIDLNNGKMVTNIPLKSKLYALIGKVYFSEKAFGKAIKNFETALNLDEGVGVKKLLRQAQEYFKKEDTHEKSK